MKEKLKKVKAKLKEWNRNEIGGIEEKIKKLTDNIEELDLFLENFECVDEDGLYGIPVCI